MARAQLFGDLVKSQWPQVQKECHLIPSNQHRLQPPGAIAFPQCKLVLGKENPKAGLSRQDVRPEGSWGIAVSSRRGEITFPWKTLKAGIDWEYVQNCNMGSFL